MTSTDLKKLIKEEEAEMDAQQMALWKKITISPEKWQLSPWADSEGGFWVVALQGNKCIYYNEIEEGFNLSQFSKRGVIDEYWCDQDKLQWTLSRMLGLNTSPRRGPPEPLD